MNRIPPGPGRFEATAVAVRQEANFLVAAKGIKTLEKEY
jgi:hypothetical protein